MKSLQTVLILLSSQSWAWAPAFTLNRILNNPSINCDRHTETFPILHSAVVQDAGDLSRPLDLQIKLSEKTSPYLIHKGRATDMIKRCVSIEGLSLSKGWTPQATEAFQLAVEAVVRANPILTGKLIETKTSPWPWDRKEIYVVPNVYNPNNHSFCKVIEPPKNMMWLGEVLDEGIYLGSNGAKRLFDYVCSNFAPYMLDRPDFTFKQIENGSPLFQAKIIDFGDGHAAYSVKMSHAIGDGTTYFQLISQISSYMNGNEPPPIKWNNPIKATHEIYPEIFSERDYHRCYGLPFGWGLLKNLRGLPTRRCKYLLLSKEKIGKIKNEMRGKKLTGMNDKATATDDDTIARGKISTNDIVMSAICEMNGSSDVFAFDRSVRGIKEGVSAYDAGNFFWEIPFDKQKGTDPTEIRKILLKDSGSFYDRNEVPLLPFLNGRVGRITSLATITHQTAFPGSELLCQFPSASFISELPLDVAVIFKFNADYWGIMHNFRKTTHSPLLEKILA